MRREPDGKGRKNISKKKGTPCAKAIWLDRHSVKRMRTKMKSVWLKRGREREVWACIRPSGSNMVAQAWNMRGL